MCVCVIADTHMPLFCAWARDCWPNRDSNAYIKYVGVGQNHIGKYTPNITLLNLFRPVHCTVYGTVRFVLYVP
jgi:hypothetical protein